MKQVLWFFVVLGLTASLASAGPNAGGVLWVHDTGVVYTDEPMTFPADPADCNGVDNQQPLWDGATPAEPLSRIWKVYAAFPPLSSPRLKTLGWGTQFPDAASSPTSYVNVTGGDRPNGETGSTLFFIGLLGFPTASGGTVGEAFPQGARQTHVTALFSFWGWAYNDGSAPPTWSTAPKAGDANFGDDGIPSTTDPIASYGSLGFGTPGTTLCPTSDPDAACCAPEGTCTITKQAACADPSVWHGDWYACEPSNPCPLPTGACCYTDGRCRLIVYSDCDRGGGVYQGDFVSCASSPCPAAAACCLAGGTCLVRTQAACAAVDPPGTWHLESTSCTPDPCSSLPTGSCCFPDGACQIQSHADCTGDWTQSGTCVPNVCPAPDVEAACCALDGTCTLTMRADCAEPSQWHADWPACDPNQCPTPQGACCALDDTCTLTILVDCAPPAIWRSASTVCDPNPCPQVEPTESKSWGQIKNRYR